MYWCKRNIATDVIGRYFRVGKEGLRRRPALATFKRTAEHVGTWWPATNAFWGAFARMTMPAQSLPYVLARFAVGP